MFSSTAAFAHDRCCSWFWWRRPSATITVDGHYSQMRFRFGGRDGCYRCHHPRKYKRHHHRRWHHRYDDDWDDRWDD